MVLFIDFAVGGIGSFIISFIVQVAAQPIDRSKLHQAVLAAMIVLHILLLVSNLFSNSMYYFDADNQYHRTSLYLLTNLGIILMLVFDAYILLRYGKNIDRRVRTAFWVYICAPIAGILLQTLFYGIQYILIASIISAVYVCLTVLKDQNEKYEAQKEESSRIETELNMAA